MLLINLPYILSILLHSVHCVVHGLHYHAGIKKATETKSSAASAHLTWKQNCPIYVCQTPNIFSKSVFQKTIHHDHLIDRTPTCNYALTKVCTVLKLCLKLSLDKFRVYFYPLSCKNSWRARLFNWPFFLFSPSSLGWFLGVCKRQSVRTRGGSSL